MCAEEELRNGGERRRVSRLKARVSYHLRRELGIPMAERARGLGAGTSAIAMVIRRKTHKVIDHCEIVDVPKNT